MAGRSDDSDEREDSQHIAFTDREEVRSWADEQGVVPVRDTEAQGERSSDLVHRDRLEDHHEEQEWDVFLDEFDERNLALTYAETGERGSGVGQHRLVDRSEVVDEHGEVDNALVQELLEGETVETEITEREVVETEVVETATIESEIVDSEIIDSEVVDTEIISEELVDVAVVEEADAEVVDADGRTYFSDDDDQVIVLEEQGAVALEIDETRVETEEQIEKKIIESRVVDDSVDAETRVDDESTAIDIDDADIHKHIGESDIVDTRSGGVINDRHIETEFDENNVATSTLTEHRTIENVVEERKVVFAEATDVNIEDSRVVSSEVVETDIVDSDMDAVTGRDAASTSGTTGSAGTAGSTDAGTTGATESAESARTTDSTVSDRGVGDDGRTEITSRQVGRDVETPDGETIGIVSDVDEDEGLLYVDRDPSLTDRMRAHLGWGDDEDASVLTADQIRHTRQDTVVVDDSGEDAARR